MLINHIPRIQRILNNFPGMSFSNRDNNRISFSLGFSIKIDQPTKCKNATLFWNEKQLIFIANLLQLKKITAM